jgi:hypothetical protein
MTTDGIASWKDGPTRAAIAVFDNDGTLWWSLETAAKHGWTVVSVKNDWNGVFSDAGG